MSKRLFSVIFAAVLISLSGTAGDKKYGKPLTVDKPTPVADLLANPEQFSGQRVLLEGTITDVCEKMGCWIKLKDGSSASEIQVKVDDGVIVFPREGKGMTVRAEGIVSVTELSEEERVSRARHEAEEQGKEFDKSSITGTATVVRLEGEGAVILGIADEVKSKE